MLTPFSKALDRDLSSLTKNGALKKIAAGLYYRPKTSRFGFVPPKPEEMVKCFLRDNDFLLFSWNDYNSLGLGLTQLYKRFVVYNRKRHGVFKLGWAEFDFRRPARGFPKKLTPEFLLVDFVNNMQEIAENPSLTKKYITSSLKKFDMRKLVDNVNRYGKIATKCFFKEMGIETISS